MSTLNLNVNSCGTVLNAAGFAFTTDGTVVRQVKFPTFYVALQ